MLKEPAHVKMVLVTYANSQLSCEPALPCSLVRALTVRSKYMELEEASNKEPHL